MVQARLFINGKDYGAHVFVIPLRSLEDHKPFPGVEIGDIGPKAFNGFNKMDNGCKYLDVLVFIIVSQGTIARALC